MEKEDFIDELTYMKKKIALLERLVHTNETQQNNENTKEHKEKDKRKKQIDIRHTIY